ncbi:MAG: hypothetical protein KAJ67_01155 [Gemmatimonadetes bacterium]|nr:hypothetical protein [Gemmatimonadota bacterium]
MTMMRSARTANDTFKQSYRTTVAFGLMGAAPAFNRDKKTAVWLSQSIDFNVG